MNKIIEKAKLTHELTKDEILMKNFLRLQIILEKNI